MGFLILRTLKALFLWIDRMVAWAIDAVYSLLLQLANVAVFGDDTLIRFKRRIGIMLGLFMLFKVAISMINYVLNPDSMSDNSKGASKLVLSIVVSLVMLVTYDYIFDKAFYFQNLILKNNVLERIFLGSSDAETVQLGFSTKEEEVSENSTISAADPVNTSGLSFYIYSAFVRPNERMFDNITFKFDGKDISSQNPAIIGDETITEQNQMKKKCRYGVWSNNTALRKICLDAIDDSVPTDWVDEGEYTAYEYAYAISPDEVKAYPEAYYIETHGQLFDAAATLKAGQLIVQEDIGLLEWDWTWRMDYYILIPTAIGIVVLLQLVGFCFDVGVRAVKLGFYRLIAPIPIIAYMDVGKGKNIFNKWLQECLNTFLSLFIRLIGLFFAIFVISEIVGNGIYGADRKTTLEFWDNPFLIIFIVLGALTFAKQLPKLIQDITGINIDGGKFSLNPLKRSPIAAGALAAGAAIGGSVGRNMALRGQHLKEQMKHAEDGEKLKTLGKGALGMLGGLGGSFRGAGAAFRGAEKNGVRGAARDSISRNTQRTSSRLAARERGFGLGDEMAEGARRFFGLRSQSEMADNEIERLNRIEQENAVFDEALARVDKEKENLDKIYQSDMQLNTLLAGIEAAKRQKDPKKVEAAQSAFVNELNRKMKSNENGLRDRVYAQTDRVNSAVANAEAASKLVKNADGHLAFEKGLDFSRMKLNKPSEFKEEKNWRWNPEKGETELVTEYTGYTTNSVAMLDGSDFRQNRVDINNANYGNTEDINYRQVKAKSDSKYVGQQGRAKSYDEIHGNSNRK